MTFNIFDKKWFDFLHAGEIIKASYNKSTVGDYTYKNVFFIVKATEDDMVAAANEKPVYVPKATTSKSEGVAPVDWDGKDRRIVKQNVLNRAVEIYLADKIKREDILKTADNFLDWVYDKFPKQEDNMKPQEEIKTIDEIEEITITEEKVE